MKITATSIADVRLLEPRVFTDARGHFFESWNHAALQNAGIHADFVQDNHSHSRQWTLRGLHYQLERPQGKLLRVVQGKVFDVVVDLRRSSPSFGQWMGIELSQDHPSRMLWVPSGCAHGYLALSQTVDFLYKCTDYYFPEHERVIHWNDPKLAISWPIPQGVRPLVSDRDARAGRLEDAECYA